MTRAFLRMAAFTLLGLGFSPAASAVDLGLELRAGYLDLTNARRSATAIFGSGSGGPTAGIGVRAEMGGLFGRVSASYFRRTGERVFVPDNRSETFRLGHPLTVTLMPAYADVGYRLGSGGSRLQPYFGFGVGMVRFNEESEVAGETLSASRQRLSTRTMLGATWGQGNLRVGAELSYSRTPDAIGVGGVSRVFGETDLGGGAVVALLHWRP